MLMLVPRPLRIIGNAILLFFAVLGGILSLAQLPQFWQPVDARTVILRLEDIVVVTPSVFGPRLQFDDRALGNDQLVETTITLWRDGGAPIEPDMIRRPLQFKMPAGSRVAAAKIVDQYSSIPNNFSVAHSDDEVVIGWKVFDPDMAVKVAIARIGSEDSPTYLDNIGPGINVTNNRYNTAKTVYYWGVLGVAFVLAGAFISGANLGALDRMATWGDKRIERLPKPIQIAVALVTTVIVIFGLVAALVGSFRFIPWLQALVVPPIPFT
ncbi:hypothetical protein ACLI1C_07565 [Devosia sp. XGJD_8]|uniref:hypothetical protein n=1 Tax=Devosia sp. XGJD_8 TaxID=3391187 RepID=UPI003984F371